MKALIPVATLILSSLVASSASASVGLWAHSPIPEETHTDVVVFREQSRISIAIHTEETPETTPLIFPVYPHMGDLRLGTLHRDSLRSLVQTTSPRFEKIVRATSCDQTAEITDAPPTVPKRNDGPPAAEFLDVEELKNVFPEFTSTQIQALQLESTKGAKFLVLRPDNDFIPVVSYRAELLEIPTRIGQLNQTKTQHLRVFVIAEKRHEISNYWNAFSPTNIALRPDISNFRDVHDTVVRRSQEAAKNKFWLEFAGSKPDQDQVITRLRLTAPAGKLDDNLTLNTTSPVVGGQPGGLSGALGGAADDFRVRYFAYAPDRPDPNCPDPTLIPRVIHRTYAERWPRPEADLPLEDVVSAPIPELFVTPRDPVAPPTPAPEVTPQAPATSTGCSCTSAGPDLAVWGLVFAGFWRRRQFKRT